jgi:DNA-3-methyladenine glycosylase II
VGDSVPTAADRAHLAAAEAHLLAADPILAGLIAAHGPCTLTPEPDLFGSLADAIVSQQISVKAAAAIMRRFLALLPGAQLDPRAILALSEETLRGAGLSRAKVAYVRDLAAHVASGALDLATLAIRPDDEVIAALVQVKGIGRWTAEMFLIFALGRLDVLPVDDLGFRRAVERAYGLPGLPAPAALHALAAPWRPYRSVATWYLWRSLNNTPNVAGA